MGDETTPVATPAVTPGSTPAPAATTTTTAPPAGDEQESISLDEARKLRREAQELRRRIKAYDDAQAQAEAAKLSETERQAKELADSIQRNEDLAAELMEAHIHQDIARLASKFNFIISPDLIARLLDFADVEWDEDTGRPTNIEKLLEKLAKASPDLVKAEQAPTQPQARFAPATPAMNPSRSSIASPGSSIPGRIPRLEDLEMWGKR